jgi:hypothetical protein
MLSVVTLLAGRLAAVLAAGTKATFVPDLASQHIEQAKTVLVSGLCLLLVDAVHLKWVVAQTVLGSARSAMRLAYGPHAVFVLAAGAKGCVHSSFGLEVW